MKNLIKRAFQFSLILININVFAQKYGLIIDEEGFNRGPKVILPETGEKAGNTNIKLDLSAYAPSVQNQDALLNCFAYALIYNAFGIEMGIRNNVTNKEELSSLALSPIYLYKKVNKNRCTEAMNTEETKKYIEANGLLPFNYLPNNNCIVSITTEMEAIAAKNKTISKVQGLAFNSKDSWQKKNREIIKILDMNKPVVVCMYLPDNILFKNLRFPSDIYLPDITNFNINKVADQNFGHAVTVVGYDKRMEAFKVLNSWGYSWANDGYCWIPFKTLGLSTVVAYYLEINEISRNINTPTKIKFEGSFGFQYIANGIFVKETPYHTDRGIYELNKKNWQLNQLFQLTTKNGNSGQSVCVFSIDANNKVELHWPFSIGMGTGDQMPAKNIEMVIPGEDTALEIQKAGTDNLIVLYSSHSLITQWESIRAKLEKSGGNSDIISRLKDALGDRLISPADINYQPAGMNFNATILPGKGDTVPLVLKIRSID